MMRIKKDLVVVALATFCLTAMLFMIRPTLSNPGLGEYDAWNDLNGDGMIDMYDAINFAGTFNTAGNPTKDVNVTNWPETWKEVSIIENFTISWNITSIPSFQGTGALYLGTIPVSGFSRMRLCVRVQNWTEVGWSNNYVRIVLAYNGTFAYGTTPEEDFYTIWDRSGPGSVYIDPGPSIKAYPDHSPAILAVPYVSFFLAGELYIANVPAPLTASCQISISAYLRNE